MLYNRTWMTQLLPEDADEMLDTLATADSAPPQIWVKKEPILPKFHHYHKYACCISEW
jgi:hypothetical protein